MSDICHEDGSVQICDLSKSLPIKRTRVSRKSGDDHLRFTLSSKSLYLIHIDPLCFFIEDIWNDIIGLTGQGEGMSMSKVSSLIKGESEDSISRLQYCKKYREICW
jgi:hypothetical protein